MQYIRIDENAAAIKAEKEKTAVAQVEEEQAFLKREKDWQNYLIKSNEERKEKERFEEEARKAEETAKAMEAEAEAQKKSEEKKK